MNQLSLGLGLLLAAAMSAAAIGQTPPVVPASSAPVAQPSTVEESGLAAVYSNRLAGHVTASGKKYDPNKLTAAHKTLPFGTRIEVTNRKNGKTVELLITDRGPHQADRILDISPRAAHALGIRKTAMAEVTLKVLGTAGDAQ